MRYASDECVSRTYDGGINNEEVVGVENLGVLVDDATDTR